MHVHEAPPIHDPELLFEELGDLIVEEERLRQLATRMTETKQQRQALLTDKETGRPLYASADSVPPEVLIALGRLDVVYSLDDYARHHIVPASNDMRHQPLDYVASRDALNLFSGHEARFTARNEAAEPPIFTITYLGDDRRSAKRTLDTVEGIILPPSRLISDLATGHFEPNLTLELSGFGHRRRAEHFAVVSMMNSAGQRLVDVEML